MSEDRIDTTVGKDPVSGNDVPLGAEPEEVRDDIPVNMSKNEYVIPADVVRYFGVEKFEKLIKQAKEGWAKMADEGRLNSTQTEEEFEEVFPTDELEYDEVEDDPEEMAEGGQVGWKATQAEMDSAGIETKQYINSKGETRSVLFASGVPIQVIPEGFYENTPEVRKRFEDERKRQEEEASKKAKKDSMTHTRTSTDTDLGPKSEVESPNIDWAGMTPEERRQEVTLGRAAAKAVGAIGGPLAGLGIGKVLDKEYAKQMTEAGLTEADIEAALDKEKSFGGLGEKIGSAVKDFINPTQNTVSKAPTTVAKVPDYGKSGTLTSSSGISISNERLASVQKAVDDAAKASRSSSNTSSSGSSRSTGSSGSSAGNVGTGLSGEDRNKGGLITPKGKPSKRKARRQRGKAKGLARKTK